MMIFEIIEIKVFRKFPAIRYVISITIMEL